MSVIDKITVDSTTYDIQDSAAQSSIAVLEPTASNSDVGKFLKVKTVANSKVTAYEFGSASGGGGSVDLFYVTPEDYGAVGDGTTDDSEAVQDAVDAGYAVYFASNKTYYLASAVTIDHDCHLFGGEGATIKTVTPSGGTANNAIVVTGSLKKTTTLTTDYTSTGTTANSGNQFTLSDMSGIEVGDIMVITAEDQYYSYARPMYYLGATLLVSDVYDGHIYTSNSMPWDITNTANVSVKIYSAPTAIIEGLNFVSDIDSLGQYTNLIDLKWCKNSIVKNCNLSHFGIGMRIYSCVNTLADCVTVSKSKYDNSMTGDGYGILVESSSDTIIQRVMAICAQGCVDLGGTIPNINTYVRNCNLTSECRAIGIDMHENSYNIVVEDCTFGGLSLYGTATVNRCRFIRNNRSDASGNAIIFRGTHNPNWATLKVSNCIFDDTLSVMIDRPNPQSPVQSFENIIGNIEITDCVGGYFVYVPTTVTSVTSNAIKNIVLKNWQNCQKIYHTSGNVIENMTVADCTFTISSGLWLTDNNVNHGIYLDYIRYLDYSSTNPMAHKVYVENTVRGGSYTLPKNTAIQLSSSNSSTAKYIVCGSNITSDNVNDYLVGTITGSVGSALTRSIASGSNIPTITMDGSGNLVYTQGSSTSNYSVCPVGMLYAKERGTFSISATLKNTGSTDGAAFYPYIAIVDCETGNVVYRGNGTKQTATAQGVSITHNYSVNANHVVIGYFYCTTAVSGAVSTFESLSFAFTPLFGTTLPVEPYNGKRTTGDGTIYSNDGVNNIMSYESTFNVKLLADYINNPIGILPSASGVSF